MIAVDPNVGNSINGVNAKANLAKGDSFNILFFIEEIVFIFFLIDSISGILILINNSVKGRELGGK